MVESTVKRNAKGQFTPKPNPVGRPRGASTLKRDDKGQFTPKNGGGGSVARARVTRDKIIKALKRYGMSEADWLKFMIRQAKVNGDKSAMTFLNSTMFPTYKPEQQPVKFNMAGDTLVEKAESVLNEVAKGKISVENGTQLLRALREVGNLIEFEQLVAKIEKIEAQLAQGFGGSQ